MSLDLAARALRALPAETAHRATVRLTGLFAPLLPKAPPDDPRLARDGLGSGFSQSHRPGGGLRQGRRGAGRDVEAGLRFCGMRHRHAQAASRQSAAAPVPACRGSAPSSIAWVSTIAAWRRRPAICGRGAGKGIVGINIGANKDSADRIADYAQAFARLAPLADYVTVNVSSPNTPGLRGLQNKDELTRLLSALIETRAAQERRSKPRSSEDRAGSGRPGARRYRARASPRPASKASSSPTPPSRGPCLKSAQRPRDGRPVRHAAVRAVDGNPAPDADASAARDRADRRGRNFVGRRCL